MKAGRNDYEGLVGDAERWTRRMLDFCRAAVGSALPGISSDRARRRHAQSGQRSLADTRREQPSLIERVAHAGRIA